MQKLKKMFRSDYTGENITVRSWWENNQWNYAQEKIDNGVINIQTSNRAVAIGNGDSRAKYELFLLKNHRAGRGAAAVQTYGCNAIYRNFSPTFTVATGPAVCKEIAESDYCDDQIVYANSEIVAQYPGKFYLIPQDMHYNSGALAAYLACFDGHKKVYLMGFDCGAGENYNNNMYAGTNGYAPANQNYSDELWVKTLVHVMETYNDVEFIRVMPTQDWYCPDEWKGMSNFRQITYGNFVTEVDL